MRPFWKTSAMVTAILVIITLVSYALGFGDVFMRRVIFENSFQYQQARDLEVNTYEAQLAKIEAQLRRADLDQSTRSNLEAQKASIEVLQEAAKERQK